MNTVTITRDGPEHLRVRAADGSVERVKMKPSLRRLLDTLDLPPEHRCWLRINPMSGEAVRMVTASPATQPILLKPPVPKEYVEEWDAFVVGPQSERS